MPFSRSRPAVFLADKPFVDAYLVTYPGSLLYVATDDGHLLQDFLDLYPQGESAGRPGVQSPKIVFQREAARGVSHQLGVHIPSHSSGKAPRSAAHDVIIDTLMLSKCDYLLKTTSAVSELAHVFNPAVSACRRIHIYPHLYLRTLAGLRYPHVSSQHAPLAPHRHTAYLTHRPARLTQLELQSYDFGVANHPLPPWMRWCSPLDCGVFSKVEEGFNRGKGARTRVKAAMIGENLFFNGNILHSHNMTLCTASIGVNATGNHFRQQTPPLGLLVEGTPVSTSHASTSYTAGSECEHSVQTELFLFEYPKAERLGCASCAALYKHHEAHRLHCVEDESKCNFTAGAEPLQRTRQQAMAPKSTVPRATAPKATAPKASMTPKATAPWWQAVVKFSAEEEEEGREAELKKGVDAMKESREADEVARLRDQLREAKGREEALQGVIAQLISLRKGQV